MASPFARLLLGTLILLARIEARGASTGTTDQYQSLAGRWQARMDESDRGLAEQWYAQPLTDTAAVQLPGSLAESGLGHRFDSRTGRYEGLDPPYLKWPSAGYTDAHRRDELGMLVAHRMTYGPTWFQRTIEIPPSWENRPTRLLLERVKWASQAWVDGNPAAGLGTRSLFTPHIYDLGRLTPGPHRLTLRIDNRPAVPIGFAGHGYGMETEPLWLGVVGRLQLFSLDPLRIEHATVQPSPDGRSAQVSVDVAGDPHSVEETTLAVSVVDPRDDQVLGVASHSLRGEDVGSSLSLAIPFSQVAQAWDEFHPKLYELRWTITTKDHIDHCGKLRIGLRTLARDGRRILLNGQPVFLRGNVECAIHPGRHTPPTDRSWWERVLRAHKEAGCNHLRFHTWCPPEVAWEVADELGLYFQVETTFWVDDWIHRTDPRPPAYGQDPSVDAWVEEESQRIIRHFEHHPSFTMFCMGNEFGSEATDWKKMQAFVERLHTAAQQALVSGTCARRSLKADEYWVTHNSGQSTRGVGPPHTDWDFTAAVQATDKPLISHETGQRPSWPDYDRLLPKYAGVMQPSNLRRLRAISQQAGCTNHRQRAEATARFAYVQYKSEHEAMRRTADLTGYQWLMMHDFTGQGEAHVGLLDAFFEAKPGITLKGIRAWNGPSVVLARFPRYTWTTDQDFEAELEIAHEGPDHLEAIAAEWQLTTVPLDEAPEVLAQGKLPIRDVRAHATSLLGKIRVPLHSLQQASALRLKVNVDEIENSWNLWAYAPADNAPQPPVELHVTRHFDASAEAILQQGGTVVLLCHGTPLSDGPKNKLGLNLLDRCLGLGSRSRDSRRSEPRGTCRFSHGRALRLAMVRAHGRRRGDCVTREPGPAAGLERRHDRRTSRRLSPACTGSLRVRFAGWRRQATRLQPGSRQSVGSTSRCSGLAPEPAAMGGFQPF